MSARYGMVIDLDRCTWMRLMHDGLCGGEQCVATSAGDFPHGTHAYGAPLPHPRGRDRLVVVLQGGEQGNSAQLDFH